MAVAGTSLGDTQCWYLWAWMGEMQDVPSHCDLLGLTERRRSLAALFLVAVGGVVAVAAVGVVAVAGGGG